MAALGSLLILAAFVLASGAFAASIAGARRGQRSLIEGGIGLFHTVTAIMAVLSALIVYAFVVGDYSIKYVQRYSDAAGAALLFGTNVAAIIATGAAVFLGYRIRQVALEGGHPVGHLRGRSLVVVGSLVALMMPYAVVMLIAWLILLLLWFVLGIPLGPGYPVRV